MTTPLSLLGRLPIDITGTIRMTSLGISAAEYAAMLREKVSVVVSRDLYCQTCGEWVRNEKVGSRRKPVKLVNVAGVSVHAGHVTTVEVRA